MIEKKILRSLVLEVFKKSPHTQAISVINDVERLVNERDLFSSKDECERFKVDYRNYEQRQLNSSDKFGILEVIWDLITERIITPGMDHSNPDFPFVSLTSFGHDVINQSAPHYYDPDGYIRFLKAMTPSLDPVIEQYVLEGLHCFRRQLFFASAVMLGAAAEKSVLLLLEAIAKSVKDPREKKGIEQLLQGARLPTVYGKISEMLTPLTRAGTIPYTVHQGCQEHLMSLFEMIRVQRNDAVHPEAGTVSKDKVFLSVQTLPVALQRVYQLIDWLNSNQI